MNLEEYEKFSPIFLKKLENDGLNKVIMKTSKRIIKYFTNYCHDNKIIQIDMEVIRDFYRWKYDFDIYSISGKRQSALRRPLIILMEYYENGSYLKTHIKPRIVKIPLKYKYVFETYKQVFINSNNVSVSWKKTKLYVIEKMFIFLNQHEKETIDLIKITDISEYILDLSSKFSKETVRMYKTIIREFFNWCYEMKITTISGKQIFPIIRKNERNILISTYSEEEIKRMLETVDTSTNRGKKNHLIISLLAYYGLRAGDIINLKFSNIDFENNKISLVQQKTKKLLTLPLLDEIKFSLLDYVKNARTESVDAEYILSTDCAPYTKIASTSSIYTVVTEIMDIAQINYQNKKHGPHSLRHSLATNMINNNVSLNAISQLLGHSSESSTEIYITKDTTHLRELTLEVPNEI